ncbi:MAG: tRNA lysidine(34) synthetase TilS [Bacteroidota bacterium]
MNLLISTIIFKTFNLENFISFIRSNNLFNKSDHLLVACSGGVDSIVLCDLLYLYGFTFSIAHCNFQLRANESDADETFVKSLGAKYHVPVYVKRFDTTNFASDNKMSVQHAARELRYNWFDQLLNERQLSFLLTAHHADDNVETVLMNFFKGTGISGMHGILPKRDKLVRPLLFTTKKEILEYAIDKGLSWVEDASNETVKYTRNFFRHKVIPLIEQTIPTASANVAQSIEHLKEVEIIYNQAIESYKKQLLIFKGNEVHIPILKLVKSVPINTIAFEILKPYGFTPAQAKELPAFLQSETGKYITSSTHRVIKNRKWIIIAPVASGEAHTLIIESTDNAVSFETGRLLFSISDNLEMSTDLSTAILDFKQIQFPLLLRKWKQGDYFYPLGMPKKKKIARFLIDQKIAKTDKEKVWVLESDQKIIWVIGQRIDNRFKVSESTKKVLRIKLVQ